MKLVFVVGTRPNFMKVAPLLDECKKHQIKTVLIHTGQHYDENMSQVFFDDLDIKKPKYNLEMAKHPKEIRGQVVIDKIKNILKKEIPDFVVVVGDVDSTHLAALATKDAGFPLAHVEAGLRTQDMSMPEEINRINVDAISDVLFCTEKEGLINLKKIKLDQKATLVGNVMIDAIRKNRKKIYQFKIIQKKNSFILSTLHREANVDKKVKLEKCFNLLNKVADKYAPIYMPLHPRTKINLNKFKIKVSHNIKLVEPVGYLEFQKLLEYSWFVLSDGAGIPDEAAYLNKPCLIMREKIERPATIKYGTTTLVGNSYTKTEKEIRKIKNGKYKRVKNRELWDGKSAERIVKKLIRLSKRQG